MEEGSVTFDLKVLDSGGTANGGQDCSAVSTITVAVQNQNNDPLVVNTTSDATRVVIVNGVEQISLRAAIALVNSGQSNGTINFDLPAGQQTIAGPFEINGDCTINGTGQNLLTISGGNTQRVFFVYNGRTVNLNNLTIADGQPDPNDAAGNIGGGILNWGILNLYQVTLTGNHAEDGGALYSMGQGAQVTIENCTLNDNHATGKGGAIYNSRQMHIQNDTVISGNTALAGGGIFNSSQMTIDSGSSVSGNSAIGNANVSRGGGIYNEGSLTMADAYLDNNNSNNQGGGLYQDYLTNPTTSLTNVSIQGNWTTNTTSGKGGGIYVATGTVTLVSGCTVSGNCSAVQNGGNGASWKTTGLFTGTLIDNPRLNTITDDLVAD